MRAPALLLSDDPDNYMNGLIEFAQAVVPGSARVIASVGDEQNALVMPTVEADFVRGR